MTTPSPRPHREGTALVRVQNPRGAVDLPLARRHLPSCPAATRRAIVGEALSDVLDAAHAVHDAASEGLVQTPLAFVLPLLGIHVMRAASRGSVEHAKGRAVLLASVGDLCARAGLSADAIESEFDASGAVITTWVRASADRVRGDWPDESIDQATRALTECVDLVSRYVWIELLIGYRPPYADRRRRRPS
jgi:hypothetical protein